MELSSAVQESSYVLNLPSRLSEMCLYVTLKAILRGRHYFIVITPIL